MKYIIYKVTNKINGKLYIGAHKTKNLDDGYLGSGKYLNYSINKHGIENFEKEILYVFDTTKEMYAKEAELVNEEFIAESNTYNLRIGGMGGFDYINHSGLNGTDIGVQRRKELLKNDPIWAAEFNATRNEGIRKYKKTISSEEWTRRGKKANKTMLQRYGKHSFTGKTHSEETKAIMSAKAKERLKDPTKNSQYGTCWIHNNRVSKKIDKNDLNEHLIEGWIKGRKIKF